MKKTLSFLLSLLIILNCFALLEFDSFAENNVINVESNIGGLNSNNEFNIDICFKANKGIMGYKMIFSYDSSALRPVQVTPGSDFNVGQLTDTIGIKDGQFNILWNNLTDFKGNGTAFTITFEKLADVQSVIDVTYSQEDTFNENWDDVILNCQDIILDFGHVDTGNPIMVTTTSTPVDSNNIFNISVNFENNTGMMGYKLIFKYDKSVVRPVLVTRGSDFSVGQLTDNIGVKDGEFNVLWNHLTNYSANGQAFIIQFEKLANTTTEIEISYSQEDTFDENWEDVLLDVHNLELDLSLPPITEGTAMTFDVGDVDNNNQFEIEANLTGNTGIMGYKIMFQYDSDVLRPISVNAGRDFNVGQITDTIGVKSDIFNVLWNNLTEFNQNGNAFIIKFELLKEEATQITVDYSSEDTFDGNWDDVELSLQNISVNLSMKKCKFVADFSEFANIHFKTGDFKVLNSLNETLLEKNMTTPQLNTLFDKSNNVDFYIKPANCVSLKFKNINAVGNVDINSYISVADNKGLFNSSRWAIGDVDGNDTVDVQDISLLLTKDIYGLANAYKDLNGDDFIDIADLSIILSSDNYGKSGVVINSNSLI